MALSNRIFNGKLNLDMSPYKIPPSDYSDALNITKDSQGEAEDMVITNVYGNQVVSYSLPAGTNKVIGSYADVVRNRIYYWVWNSNGHNLWLYYDKNDDTITKLIEDLTDTGSVAVLDFDPSKKINHVDIIYRDQEGDLVFWTDGNTTPKKANVTTIENGTYGTITSELIEVAKAPPLSPPLCTYGSDLTRNANSLRRKLFQFTSAFKYDDFEISSFSTYSKIPLPIGYYGSDNDLDSTSNNYITVEIETGDENVTDIVLAVRSNIGNAWGDFVQVASLNKSELGIPDNSTYQFLFYNDALYPPLTEGVQYVDGVQVVPLFYWVPQKADTQCLANGNIPVYGAITENYDNYPVSDLQVTITAANQTNTPPDTDPPAMTYEQVSLDFTFTITGSVPVGTLYKVVCFIPGTPPSVITVAQYTSVLGDTIADVAQEMYNYVLANYSAYASSFNTTSFTINLPAGSSITQTIVQAGSSGGGISTEKTWMWDANYIFGIVYVDEQNRDMPGVTTYSSPVNSDDDFVVTTPSFSVSGSDVQTPVISASINHLPPTGAVKYYWVRRRQTYGSFLMYMTCDLQEDTDYYYFCLDNIDKFKENNSQFIYGTAPITAESRIKIIAGISGTGYNGTLYTQDYQILGTLTRTLSGGTSPEDDRPFIKVQKPIAAVSPAYTQFMLVMIYTPAQNPTTLEESVYWEWGEAYDIYESGGVRYHRGGDQDQTAVQPATFTFEEGDVYFHQRPMHQDVTGAAPYTPVEFPIMDANYSDYFDSAVNDNGRGQVIAANAGQTFNPTLYRFGQEYQNGTNINGSNAFLFENFDECDRRFGSIKKMFIEKRYLYLFQEFDIGLVPILTQIVKDVQGNPLEANSDILLNKVMYPYQGQFGIGNVPESFAYGKGGMYFIDNNKGVVCRLSQNGVTPLSVVFQCNSFFVSKLKNYKSDLNNGNPPSGGVYTGNPTCYGVFEGATNKYIIALEEINRYNSQGYLTFHQDPVTISFFEANGEAQGFESQFSYYPENLCNINNLLVSFKNGALWKHDSTTYCNFYGTQYNAYIEAVFNDNTLQKKTWESLTLMSNTKFSCPVIYTNVMSYGSQRQETTLLESDFTVFEEYPSASFYRDRHSIGGESNGDVMKGAYMVIRFQKDNANNLIILNGVSVKYIDSPLTPI